MCCPVAFADAIPPPDKTRFWTRPDGGTLAWDEYADPQGKALLFCHGWPSCRLQARMMHGEALAHGLRVIAPDRPGVGLESFGQGTAGVMADSDVYFQNWKHRHPIGHRE